MQKLTDMRLSCHLVVDFYSLMKLFSNILVFKLFRLLRQAIFLFLWKLKTLQKYTKCLEFFQTPIQMMFQ